MRKPSSGSRCGDEDHDDVVVVDVVVYHIYNHVVVYYDDHGVVYDDGKHPCPNM